ncbi:MAG TPA: redox-regulated ATPase YchF, partial [Methanothrix sp.]|nr:redox-regulated ATPase YchF [Methanothrix sp.]
MLSVGLAGKPNAGKSTFFKAATLAEVEIANYPFTTIDANHGVSYVRVPCPCRELGAGNECGRCRDGTRYVPVELIDVAGLVPDAHLGKGLGNEFLDSLRVAEAVIHVLDASGSADAEGNPVGVGNYDPMNDVLFLKREIGMWLYGILNRNWERLMRRVRAEGIKVEPLITEQLAGAGVTDQHVRWALSVMKSEPARWGEDELKRFAELLRDASKPMIIAANKVDIAPPEFVERLAGLDEIVVPTSAAAEVALRMADKSGAIRYRPGDQDFELVKDLSGPQKAGLEKIRAILKATTGGTGVQECIDRAVFELLEYIPVFPVEDEGKWTDRNGVVLPDAYLMK